MIILRQFGQLRQLLEQIRQEWIFYKQDWTSPGFRAVAVHRLGAGLKTLRPGLIRPALSILQRMMFRYVRNHYGIELPSTTVVGHRFYIVHQGGIVIHPRAEFGDDCIIRQNTTIGAASHGRSWEAPKLGNRVQVGCGVVIVGNVKIGDGARIGPNTVVMTDVPADATVFVAPPRIIQMQSVQKINREKEAGDHVDVENRRK